MVSSGGSHGMGEIEYPSWFSGHVQSSYNSLAGWIEETGTGNGYWTDLTGASHLVLELDNPYEDVDAYDPVQPLALLMSKANDFLDHVEGLDHIQDYAKILSFGENFSNDSTSILSDAAISDAVSQYSGRQRQVHNNSLARFKGGMADINAVQGSAYLLGIEMMEEEFNRNIGDFNAQLTVTGMQMRQRYVEKAAGEMFRFVLGIVDARKAGYASQSEYIRTKITAEYQEAERNVLLNHKERHWPLELHQYLANMHASVGGGAGMSSQEWRTSSSNWSVL